MERDIYRQAIQQWGKPLQMIMALEEMSELTKELTKNLRGKSNRFQICEEIADVWIMLEQLKEMFDGNGISVQEQKKAKFERLKIMLAENPSAEDVVNRKFKSPPKGH